MGTKEDETSRRQFLRLAAAFGVTTPFAFSACSSNGAGSAATTSSTGLSATGSATTVPAAPSTVTTAETSTTAALAPGQFDPSLGYWQQGGFQPVGDELDTTELAVTGSIPSSLNGLYVRNGSNGLSDTAHWFFGEGMVHGVELAGGAAISYRNRYVRTPVYDAAISGGGGGVAQPGGEASQSNVSVVSHGGRLMSLGEIGWPYELDPTDLSTIGPINFGGQLGPNLTAHPKVDPATGLLHAFGYGLLSPPFLTYYVISADGTEIIHATPIETGASTMIHDFAITGSDVVFWEGPVLFDLNMAIGGAPIPYRWDPDYGSRFGVMPLGGTGDKIRWVDVDPMFIFHGTNAYREGDEIVVNASKLPDFFKRRDGLDGPSVLTQFRLDTSGDQLTASEELLEELPLDLPTFDRRFLTEPVDRVNYVTTQQSEDGDLWFEGITGYDFKTGKLDRWVSGPELQPNEALFVADSDSAGQGEGWLLSYAWNRAEDRSDLVILDATDLASGPVATIELPQRVPFGFHAAFHRA